MVIPISDADVTDEEQLPIGFVVGEFAVEKLLGIGGFARVYQAKHPVLGQLVAIKVLTKAVGADPEAMRRFIREAQAASRIDHANVVKVLGFGRLTDGRAYQLMELVDGPTLDDHLRRHGALPLAQALAFLDGIATALSAAHALGIVHRDLKPANVLLENRNGTLVPRLTDFGIAKALDGEQDSKLTRTGSTLGTPAYMSPEQALGKSIGASSDVYAFGVLAFELFSGDVPFVGESPFAIMMQHVQEPPPLLSIVSPRLGPTFDQAILAMLNKRPELRPPSVAQAMQRLHAAAVPVVTSLATDVRTAAVLGTSKRRAGTAIAVATSIGIALAAFFWFFNNTEPAKAPDQAPPSARTLPQPSLSISERSTPTTDVTSITPPAPSTTPDARPANRRPPTAPATSTPDKTRRGGKTTRQPVVGTTAPGNGSDRPNDDGSIEAPPDYEATP